MLNLMTVMIGGAIGAGARHLVNGAALRLVGASFPWGTMALNIVGSFAMGLLVGVLARRTGDTTTTRLFLATGVLGGFTTFSAFSLDFAMLWERGAQGQAMGYATASVLASLAAIFIGLWLVRAIG